jgi:hypothetical protein
MNDNHTPLPWYIHDLTGMGGSISISATTPDHITIADMGPAMTNSKEEQLANAELIVSSQRLHEALHLIHLIGGDTEKKLTGSDAHEMVRIAREALQIDSQ